MLVFGLRSTSDDWPGWLMDSNLICHPAPAKKVELVERKSEKHKFLGDPNSYLSIWGGGGRGVEKTQTETTEDPN